MLNSRAFERSEKAASLEKPPPGRLRMTEYRSFLPAVPIRFETGGAVSSAKTGLSSRPSWRSPDPERQGGRRGRSGVELAISRFPFDLPLPFSGGTNVRA